MHLSTRTKRILLVLLWAIPAAAVVWWATKQDAPRFPDTFGGVMIVVGAIGIYAVATVIRAERWERILRGAGVEAKRADVYALVPIGYMGNNVLPARGGELLRMFLLGGRTEATKRTILGTIVAERVLDAVALGVILLVLAFDLLSELPRPHLGLALAIGGGLLALALVGAVIALRQRERLAFLLRALLPLAQPSRQLLSRRGAALLAMSLGIWLLEASVYIAVGQALDIELGLDDGLAVVAFTNAAALIPAAPGYIGTYDAAVIFAVRAVNTASRATIVSYLLLLRFVLFLPITIAGFVALVLRFGGLARVRAARAAARAEARAIA